MLGRRPSWGCAGMLAEAYGRTAIGDAEPAAACAFAPLALSAANAETLTRRGLVVVDDVLSAGELAAARRDAATPTSAPAFDRPCASSAASPTRSRGAATK